eukprot:44011-Ditylum_brightwellii.AAC.1
MDIAANGDTPYSQEQIPTNAFNAMYQTGLQLQQAAGTNFTSNSAIQDNLQQDTIDALANLASATLDDHNAVTNLTSSNATLAAQIKKLA